MAEEESVKVFVGQVPKHLTESQLVSFFSEFAVVDQVNLIKDKLTKASRGCCFVICPSRKEADKVVNACHNNKTLPGASNPLQVKYADGELERLEHKLFIGMLPKNVSEDKVSALFSQYGTIKELQILRGAQQTSKGCAFLKYDTKEQALAAMDAINGKCKMEGSNVPLVVKWADTEKERHARRLQRAQSANFDPSQHSSLFGEMPMGYLPAYNGYGYQAPGGYGLLPYRMPPLQNQPPFRNIPSVNQGNELHGTKPDMSPGVEPRIYARSVYPAGLSLQYPLSYPRGIVNQRPGAGSSSGSHVEGPPGANLFIYHIPQEFGDQELADAFESFGTVLSAKVFIDKVTGLSKCFGFVSYDSPDAAQAAISGMNGCQLGGKKLKVQLKRDNKLNNLHYSHLNHATE